MTATTSSVRIRLPSVFRPDAGGRAELRVEARTVGEALHALSRSHPALAARMLGPDGRPRRYVSLFVNDEDVRQLGGADAPLSDGDELTVVPALSGGAGGGGDRAGDGARESSGPLSTVAALAEASPEAEICGFVLTGRNGAALEIVPVRNAAAEPDRAFAMAPADVLRVLRAAEAEGREVAAVYHSHLTGSARLSAADVSRLTVDGRPVIAGAELWIAGVEQGRAVEVRAYGWTGSGWAERSHCVGPFTSRESRQSLADV